MFRNGWNSIKDGIVLGWAKSLHNLVGNRTNAQSQSPWLCHLCVWLASMALIGSKSYTGLGLKHSSSSSSISRNHLGRLLWKYESYKEVRQTWRIIKGHQIMGDRSKTLRYLVPFVQSSSPLLNNQKISYIHYSLVSFIFFNKMKSLFAISETLWKIFIFKLFWIGEDGTGNKQTILESTYFYCRLCCDRCN